MSESKKEDFLQRTVEHIDIKEHDARDLIAAMDHMSFSARDLSRASQYYDKMLADKECSIILSLAGSTSAAGCMQVYVEMAKNNMIDAVVATGASIVDMDFLEALGFKHYHGTPFVDDTELRKHYIDRIYDTYIDEEELQNVDMTIKEIADGLEVRPYSSREFIWEMGKWLTENPDRAVKKDSLIQIAYENNIPIFCPAFNDSSAGLGLIVHYTERPDNHMTIDSVKDFLELTQIKMEAGTTGIVMVGGGVPKNFVQDTVIGAEVLGKDVPMHKYTVQITVADERDGALSGSTLKEARSWGKVDETYEQMVFAEATTVIPLLASYGYHMKNWESREKREWTKLFQK